MVVIDPAEEIRRLVEEEEIPLAEARARVREDLQRRQKVEAKPWQRSKNNPTYKWDRKAAIRGNLNARGKSGRPRSKSRT